MDPVGRVVATLDLANVDPLVYEVSVEALDISSDIDPVGRVVDTLDIVDVVPKVVAREESHDRAHEQSGGLQIIHL